MDFCSNFSPGDQLCGPEVPIPDVRLEQSAQEETGGEGKTEEARDRGRGRKRGEGRVGREWEGEKHTAGQAQG